MLNQPKINCAPGWYPRAWVPACVQWGHISWATYKLPLWGFAWLSSTRVGGGWCATRQFTQFNRQLIGGTAGPHQTPARTPAGQRGSSVLFVFSRACASGTHRRNASTHARAEMGPVYAACSGPQPACLSPPCALAEGECIRAELAGASLNQKVGYVSFPCANENSVYFRDIP